MKSPAAVAVPKGVVTTTSTNPGAWAAVVAVILFSELLAAYPSLTAEDLANAWNYARTHREEMDREISANGDDA